MQIEQAFQIVYELAQENQLTEREVKQDIDLKSEYDKQKEALNQVHDFLVNNVYN